LDVNLNIVLNCINNAILIGKKRRKRNDKEKRIKEKKRSIVTDSNFRLN
jgi:hypothetical protein